MCILARVCQILACAYMIQKDFFEEIFFYFFYFTYQSPVEYPTTSLPWHRSYSLAFFRVVHSFTRSIPSDCFAAIRDIDLRRDANGSKIP